MQNVKQESERWPITAEDRREAVDNLLKIIRSDDWPMVIRACRVLINMDLANLKHEQHEGQLRQALTKILASRN